MGVSANQQGPRHMWNDVDKIPPFVPKGSHVKISKHVPAGRLVPTGKPVYARKPVSADNSFSSDWRKHGARSYHKPTSTYLH